MEAEYRPDGGFFSDIGEEGYLSGFDLGPPEFDGNDLLVNDERRPAAPVYAPRPDMVLPDDIGELLDTSLLPSGLPGDATQKYFVEGHPNLLVRCNDGDDYDELATANAAASRMAQYDINVLPAKTLQHDGHNYTITEIIDGQQLDTYLQTLPVEQAAAIADTLHARLAMWLSTEVDEDRLAVSDVFGLYQYMYGIRPGETEARVWLVDLPLYACDETDYAFDLPHLTNAILEAERLLGVRLPASREALVCALDVIDDVQIPDGGATEKVLQALDTSIPIPYDAPEDTGPITLQTLRDAGYDV